jgi:hypothetical protein
LQLTSYNVLFCVALGIYVIALFAASRLPKVTKISKVVRSSASPETSEISSVASERDA